MITRHFSAETSMSRFLRISEVVKTTSANEWPEADERGRSWQSRALTDAKVKALAQP